MRHKYGDDPTTCVICGQTMPGNSVCPGRMLSWWEKIDPFMAIMVFFLTILLYTLLISPPNVPKKPAGPDPIVEYAR